MTELPHHRPSDPDSNPAAADTGEGLEGHEFGEPDIPDVFVGPEDPDEDTTPVTEVVRERPDPPFRTPDTH